MYDVFEHIVTRAYAWSEAHRYIRQQYPTAGGVTTRDGDMDELVTAVRDSLTKGGGSLDLRCAHGELIP